MKTIKVIDLLKILLTQVGDIPKYIYFEDFKYKYDEKENDYYCEQTGYFLFANVLGDVLEAHFNSSITIIEEDKEIEPLNKLIVLECPTENESKLLLFCANLQRKQEEIIKLLNELKKGK